MKRVYGLTYYDCTDCGKQLSYQGHMSKGKRCRSCATKQLIKEKKFAQDGFKKGNVYGEKFFTGQSATKGSYKKGHKFSQTTILKFRRSRLGIHNSPNTEFKPSATKKKLRKYKHLQTPEYNSWRKRVFRRDDYTCQDCKYVGGSLQAHHKHSWINYPKERYWLKNGLTLCVKCHKKRHKKVSLSYLLAPPNRKWLSLR